MHLPLPLPVAADAALLRTEHAAPLLSLAQFWQTEVLAGQEGTRTSRVCYTIKYVGTNDTVCMYTPNMPKQTCTHTHT